MILRSLSRILKGSEGIFEISGILWSFSSNFEGFDGIFGIYWIF